MLSSFGNYDIIFRKPQTIMAISQSTRLIPQTINCQLAKLKTTFSSLSADIKGNDTIICKKEKVWI